MTSLAAFLLAMALGAECGSMAFKADDCRREAKVWAAALDVAAIPWAVAARPEAP